MPTTNLTIRHADPWGASAPGVLSAVRDNERHALASELHDGPAQALAYATLRIQSAVARVDNSPETARAALEQAEAATRDAMRQVRNLMKGLSAVPLERGCLVDALRSECAAVTRRGDVAANLEVRGQRRPLADSRETALYRAAREALLNAERHSGGRRVTVTVHFRADAVDVLVVDNGTGLPMGVERKARHEGRLGMVTMRERIAAMGGRMKLGTAAEGGASVALTCPYKEDAAGGRGESL